MRKFKHSVAALQRETASLLSAYLVGMGRKHFLFAGLLLLLHSGVVILGMGGSMLSFIYTGFTGTNLSLDGAAVVPPSGLLELTGNGAGLKGHAVYPTPMLFRGSSGSGVSSFTTRFVFGILRHYPDLQLSGEGIIFFIGSSRNFSSESANEYLGLFNSEDNGNATNHVFGVELDTITDVRFHDINSNHVGVDINDLTSVQSHPAGYYDDKTGDFQNLTLNSGDAMQVWVDYDGDSAQINVFLAPIEMDKPLKPLLHTTFNLSAVLVDPAFVGFSASTGMFAGSRHYVLGWSFSMNGPAPAIDLVKLPKLPVQEGSNSRIRTMEILLPIVLTVLIVTVISVTVLFVWRRHVKYSEVQEDWEVEFGPHRFSYKDIFHATEGFNSKMFLGIGGFGSVYKGVLQKSKIEVAVKRLSHESKQGVKEFVAEVVTVGRLRHRNLVQLLGYCRRKGELFLIYDYMPNGSLDKYLYGDGNTLNWAERFKIIKGVASGLLYMHEEWEKVVIHRDIKASNVLLDTEMNARLGDFGLARLYDHGDDPQTTHVAGTMGYIAPELARTGKASPLTDVFAFGAFVLEATCGRRPIDRRRMQDNQLMLVDWVFEHLQNESLIEVVDARLQGNHNNDDQIFLALKLGLMCSHPLPASRPSMRQVMQYLKGDLPLPELTPLQSSFSMLALMQNGGFDPVVPPHPPSLLTTIVTITGLSGGR